VPPRGHAARLSRLLVDAVLPLTLATLTLITVLAVQQAQALAERHDLRVALRITQLAAALVTDMDTAPQLLLDRALRDGRNDQLRRIELRRPDGSVLGSGNPTAEATRTSYRVALGDHGKSSLLSVLIDPQPLRTAQQQIWLLGTSAALGTLALTWLAARIIRRRLRLRPQSQNQQTEVSGEVSGRSRTADRIRISAGHFEPPHAVAIREKARFVAMVGHHFRQPLQALQLFTASLQACPDAGQQPVLRQMRASIDTMTHLLDVLLDIAQLDAGVVSTHPVAFATAELFQQHLDELRDTAAQHGVTLLWRGSQHRLYGDAALSGRLLRELISNATTDAPQGRVLIAVRRRGARFRIEVRDNGSGIAVSDQPRIFEEFVQLPADHGERREGYGLGLALAERLARLLDTRIGLRSIPGRGSTFWFELPSAP
jgi:signal transduction histidine kinase